MSDNTIVIEEIDDLLKTNGLYSIHLRGRVIEISKRRIDEYSLQFDHNTIVKIRKLVRHIIHCLANNSFCKNLERLLMNTSMVVNISIDIEDKRGKYFVKNIFVAGIKMMLNRRRARRDNRQCPRGFICHGTTNVTSTTMGSSVVKKSSIPCEKEGSSCSSFGKNSQAQDLNGKKFLIDFHVYKSLEQSQQSIEGPSKHFKAIAIKRVFGITSSKRSTTTRNSTDTQGSVFKTLGKALSEISKK